VSDSKKPFSSPIIKFFWLFLLLLAGVLVWSYIQDPESERSLTDEPPAEFESSIEIRVDVDQIAGKTPDQVASVLGEPLSKETVTPSNTPCPCDKFIYKDGKVEVVYMNGKSDWITVNYPSSFVKGEGPFLSVDQFPSYSFVKVKTP
jgi:hypothetical protein